MSDQLKISMGRARQAYALNGNEVENAIQALWPGDVFPLELWSKAHETFWRAFADANQAIYKVQVPALPELDTAKKYFYTHLCALDILNFFKKMSEIIHSNVLREGIQYILEESYEEPDAIFPEEMDFLFSTLLRLETVDPFDQYKQYPEDEFNSVYEEKILSIPHSSYHFIADIFPDTILVDTVAVIRHFRHYPLRQEVKGLTQRLVDSVLNVPALEVQPITKTATPLAEPAAEEQLQDQENSIPVPSSLWKGKPDTAVRDAMKADYDIAVIAYVLLNWCGVNKTRVGKLLSDDEYEDDKSYRNFVDRLLKRVASFTIIRA